MVWWRPNAVVAAVLMLASLLGGLSAGIDLHETVAREIGTRMRACH